MSVALGIPPQFLRVDLHQVLVMRPCWTLAPWLFRSDAAGSRQGGMPPDEDEPITTGRYGAGSAAHHDRPRPRREDGLRAGARLRTGEANAPPGGTVQV